MASGSKWIEEEIELLRQQILQAIPNGVYTIAPPLLWTRVAQRIRKRAFSRFSQRMYTPQDCRQQYFTHIRPLLLKRAQTSIGERAWSEDERDTLREYISATLPGGLLGGRMIPWAEVAERMFEDGLVTWSPFRLYDERNVREQYSKHIGPRLANRKEIELALKYAEEPRVPPPSIIPSRSLPSLKLDTNSIRMILFLQAQSVVALALRSIRRTPLHLQCRLVHLPQHQLSRTPTRDLFYSLMSIKIGFSDATGMC
jgi:hypothetical protein